MRHIMATEAQKLISISLAKIAASRCVRGGVSLHKNLLVATVLQKARYIFMEEAFHMVHGHYINQANSKFIQQLRYQEQLENQIRQNDREYDEDDDSAQLDDSELDLFSSPIDSNEKRNFLSDSNSENDSSDSSKENSPSSTSVPDLIYLDLDMNSRSVQSENSHQNSAIGQKRRLSDDSENDTGDDILLLLPKSKQLKISRNVETSSSSIASKTKSSSNESSDNCLSLDFLSSDLNLTSAASGKNTAIAPLDMSCNTSALSSSSSPTCTTNPLISPTSSSIDRITSLVSIFNFGNLQRSVSAPDLCSSNHSSVDNSCCNIQQRQIAMTV